MFVHCTDPDTAKEILFEACCCRLARFGLPCNYSGIDPACSVDLMIPNETVFTRLQKIPGVLEVASCPKGQPTLKHPEEIREQILHSPWAHELHQTLVSSH